MLLLQREQELYLLRLGRDRTSAWLRAVQGLSVEFQDDLAACQGWALQMIRELHFQTAAVYALASGAEQFDLLRGHSNTVLASHVEVDADLLLFLEQNPSGLRNGPTLPALEKLSSALGLHRFLWVSIKADGHAQNLLVAGFQGDAAMCQHPLTQEDLDYFTILAHHLSALVRNAHLVRALDRERNELLELNREHVQTNAQLQASLKTISETQSQLAHAERMGSLGRLAAGVAHEINNPLTSVVANIELALEALRRRRRGNTQAPPPELEESLADAHDGASRVAEIVRGLRAFSRSDDGLCLPVDVQAAVDAAIQLASNQVRHRATLVKDFAKAPRVDVKESRLVQVVLNLLINAAQAIPEGAAERNEIRLGVGTDEAGRAFIDVRDTGVGMKAQLLKRIFDPFFTTKAVGVGTGLGLSICHGIVAGWGGTIDVSSEEGKGSYFRVTLPASTSTEATPRPPRTPPLKRRRARVLVIDDDVAVLRSIERTLGHDHEVVGLGDAREALLRLSRGEVFDVVLCDLMMPELTGVELHEALVAVAPAAAERFVFVTGGAFTPAAEELIASLDASQVLMKPFSVTQVRELIAQRMDAQGAAPAQGKMAASGELVLLRGVDTLSRTRRFGGRL